MSEFGNPKVILIGGVGCTGKTTFAAQLMKKYGMPYFPIDYLMMGMTRSGSTNIFTPIDSVEVIAPELWSVVKAMAMTSIENNHSMIFEGFQLLPKYLGHFDTAYQPHVLPLCLGFSSDYIDEHFMNSIALFRNQTETRDFSDENVQQMKMDNLKMKSECTQYNIPFFEATRSYDRMVENALDYIESAMSLGK